MVSEASPAADSGAVPAAAFTAVRLCIVLFLIAVCFSFVFFIWEKHFLLAALLCVGAVFATYKILLSQEETLSPLPTTKRKVHKKMTESFRKHTLPPPQPAVYCMRRPRLVKCFLANTPPPLRDVSMDFPAAMSPQQAIQAFRRLGIYPQVEDWRDRLRQWCSSALLKPLLDKIETSHIQLMQKLSKIGITSTISPVGRRSDQHVTRTTVLPQDRKRGWQLTYSSDEEGLLRELLQTLTHTIDAYVSIEKDLKERQETREKFLARKHQTPRHQQTSWQQRCVQQRQAARISNLQECVDSISEYLKIQCSTKRLMEEWAKGLFPCGSFTVDYTIQRIRELAHGSCVKSYEHSSMADSHLLLYLFYTFLEQTYWMEPASGIQTMGKCITVVSGFPSTLQDNAFVLALDKQSPRFALYWDKKLQFTLQGATAVWDSMVLICYIIKRKYGGVAGGLNLRSYSLLRVLDD